MLGSPHDFANQQNADSSTPIWQIRRAVSSTPITSNVKLGGRSRKYLSGLAPVAHNMIRWFSEHDFEQQLMVSRTKRILLQTLYFAYLAKIEAVITELLARLNYTCGHDQELKLNTGIGGCIAAADVLLQSWNEEVGQRHC
uniref:Uncharacterized protein n=1 Tax=Physcomitrium patens TaxID=3218 RepID=A0A2K1ISD5_PHYPA|nr:hypothetical protein PHYPA_026308 [Physcomitrium patens]